MRQRQYPGPNPFLGNSGEVFVLTYGSVWEIGIGEYNYLYQYYASVQKIYLEMDSI